MNNIASIIQKICGVTGVTLLFFLGSIPMAAGITIGVAVGVVGLAATMYNSPKRNKPLGYNCE